MRFLALFVGVLLTVTGTRSLADSQSWQISSLDWARPRSGAELLQDPNIGQAVRALLERPDSRLEIRYPGGDDGSVWASELKGWLVALAVGSERIELVPGAHPAHLELKVVE